LTSPVHLTHHIVLVLAAASIAFETPELYRWHPVTRRELLTWPFSEVNVSHPHMTVDGTRISAEAAGCDANWHMYPDSGHSDNGTMAKPSLPPPSPLPLPPPAPQLAATGECDVCHLHYYHKVLTRASTLTSALIRADTTRHFVTPAPTSIFPRCRMLPD
jgi:hypothetical protein